jgi:hypothetical protein
MRRSCLTLMLAALLDPGTWLHPAAAHDHGMTLSTDVNVLTALDVSDSIGKPDAALQFEGVAEAILASEFLDRVDAGQHGRIGFAVYTWAAGRNLRVVVPWTLIGSADDAGRVAAELRRAAGVECASVTRPKVDDGPALVWYEFRTDISAAIDHGRTLLAAAPYEAGRAVLNLCANGEDNVGTGPSRARDHAVASGLTVNALALGEHAELGPYLRATVQGGPASFVLEAKAYADFTEAMLRKFLMDLIAEQAVAGPAVRG